MDYSTRKAIYDQISYRKYGYMTGRLSSCDHQWGLIFPNGDDRAEHGCTECGIPIPTQDEISAFLGE